MNRFIIVPLGLLSILAAVATGCAVETTSSEGTSDDDLTSEGVRMVGIAGDGSEQDSIANDRTGPHAAGPHAPEALCLSCGPLPDPWKNGPLPDPWTQRPPGKGTPEGTSSSSSGGPGHK